MSFIPYLEPANHITCRTAGVIAEGRFVMADTSIAWNPVGLNATATPNVPGVKQIDAIKMIVFGIAANDVTSDDVTAGKTGLTVYRVGVVPALSGAAVTKGGVVTSDDQGRVIDIATGYYPCGVALTAATGANQSVAVMLNLGLIPAA